MKKQCLIGIVLVCLLTLMGCKSHVYSPTEINQDYLHENWMQTINLDPAVWTRSADPWYQNGATNQAERAINTAGARYAISIMNVRVADFTNIKVDGNIQVQIVGGRDHNSVYIAGTNHDVREVIAEVDQNTLYIHATKDCKDNLSKVIVRIGMKNLRSITNLGPALILGRYITSDHLTITNCSSGCIILNGRVVLTQVTQIGNGTVTVIGACTPSLQIDVNGNGNVNVSGQVGVNRITHKGNGNVNVIGANGARLCITASGNGLTTVVGCTNLEGISASGNSRVYAYWVNSYGLHVRASGCAQIGLAGRTANMDLDVSGSARFQGQYLHAGSLYVRTSNTSHATITADKKIFAAATDESSIYFYGSPDIVSRYTDQSGSVIPVWMKLTAVPVTPARPCYKR